MSEYSAARGLVYLLNAIKSAGCFITFSAIVSFCIGFAILKEAYIQFVECLVVELAGVKFPENEMMVKCLPSVVLEEHSRKEVICPEPGERNLNMKIITQLNTYISKPLDWCRNKVRLHGNLLGHSICESTKNHHGCLASL